MVTTGDPPWLRKPPYLLKMLLFAMRNCQVTLELRPSLLNLGHLLLPFFGLKKSHSLFWIPGGSFTSQLSWWHQNLPSSAYVFMLNPITSLETPQRSYRCQTMSDPFWPKVRYPTFLHVWPPKRTHPEHSRPSSHSPVWALQPWLSQRPAHLGSSSLPESSNHQSGFGFGFWGGISTVSQIFTVTRLLSFRKKRKDKLTNPGCHQPSIPPRWKNAMILKNGRGKTRKTMAKTHQNPYIIHTQNSWYLWTCPKIFPQKMVVWSIGGAQKLRRSPVTCSFLVNSL